MIDDSNKCATCMFCDKSDCKQKIPIIPMVSPIKRMLYLIIFGGAIWELFSGIALYFFIQGSHQQNDSWSAAWDAYYCSQAIFPTCVMIATIAIPWVFAVLALCFKADEW